MHGKIIFLQAQWKFSKHICSKSHASDRSFYTVSRFMCLPWPLWPECKSCSAVSIEFSM